MEVDDVQAVALGEKIAAPPVKIPTGTLAWLSRPSLTQALNEAGECERIGFSMYRVSKK
jgi:hypothetical protein